MKLLKSLLALSAFTLIIGGAFATAAIAQSPEGPYLRLEDPLEIGDTILEPGVYKITVVPGNRHDVLKVKSEDGTKTLATVLTTPHAAAATANQKYVYFPTADGTTRVLRTWFHPDSAIGYDIVYPEPRALELAVVADEPVVAYKGGTVTADLGNVELAVVSPNEEVSVYVAPDRAMPDDTEEPVVIAEVPRRDQARGDRDQVRRDRADELPRTASRLPFLAALGFLLLLAAGGVHVLRKV